MAAADEGGEGAGEGTGTEGEGAEGISGAGELTLEQAKAELARTRREAANYRTKVKELEPFKTKAEELANAGKSDVEKLTGANTELTGKLNETALAAMRYEVALDKGLTKAQARRLVGSTPEELVADADAMLEELGGKGAGEGKAPPSRTPRERLKSGGGKGDEDPEEMDPRKLVASIRRR